VTVVPRAPNWLSTGLTVTDFSGEDKASGVEFYTVVQRRPGQGISHFGELRSSRSPISDESARRAAASIADRRQSPTVTASARGTPWACVNIRPSPKTDVLVLLVFAHTPLGLLINFHYSHMPIGKVWIYRLLFMCFVCLFVCAVTDFVGRRSSSKLTNGDVDDDDDDDDGGGG